MKIFLKDLACYKEATKEQKKHKLVKPERCFDLGKLPTKGLQDEMQQFIYERGKNLTVLSIRAEFYPFNLLCKMLKDKFPALQSFHDVELSKMIDEAKRWLMKNGKSIIRNRKRTATGKIEAADSDLIRYIRMIYVFLNPEKEVFVYENDKWYLKNLPFELRMNPVKPTKSISFEKIKQKQIREEVKKVIYHSLSVKALGTVLAEMSAVNRFADYLHHTYPDVSSLELLDREILEDYLVHTNTEACGRKSYCTELKHLKGFLKTAAKVLEVKELGNLFYADDIGPATQQIYKVYSDAEIKRLNEAIVNDDAQLARALFLHQLLGTRISETLSLKRNSVYQDSRGIWKIRIYQVKTAKSTEKIISDEIRRLFESACEYTQKQYGNTEYVFVSDKDPLKPMHYSRVQYRLMAIITKNDLRDDNGIKFGVGTHIWRHVYGKKLTEMHIEDALIAKLLGHSNTSSLKYYRKIGNEMLSAETQTVRQELDKILKATIQDWNI